jgi:hypothetical protein
MSGIAGKAADAAIRSSFAARDKEYDATESFRGSG